MPALFRATLIALLMISSATPRANTVGLGGARDCGTWTRDNPAQGGLGLLYQQWVFGFLSAASHADPDHDPLKGIDVAAIMQWLDEYCQHSPNVPLADAATAFVQAHHPP